MTARPEEGAVREPRFVERAASAKSEVWHLESLDGDAVTVGWHKGSRWIAVADASGEAKLACLTVEQMRQLGEIAREI